jgi:hypothetical protein
MRKLGAGYIQTMYSKKVSFLKAQPNRAKKAPHSGKSAVPGINNLQAKFSSQSVLIRFD